MAKEMLEVEVTTEAAKQPFHFIDNRAEIHPTAQIDHNVTIGPWCYIGPNVSIGAGTRLASHVVISENTKIGRNNNIYASVVLGGDPQDIRYTNEPTYLEIGDHNIIREFVTISRGSADAPGLTKVGSHNCFLAYSHVAHDCVVGDYVLLVNHAALAGHVILHDYVTIGAYSAVHQFVTVGAYSFLSRATLVGKDVLPYLIVVGNPGAPCGLNTVGLKRNGFSDDTVAHLKRAYSVVFRRGLKLTEIKETLIEMAKSEPAIERMLDIMNRSQRGIAR